ncbi:sodium-dependent nutrient amino acid transporter 1-like [Ostrinia furnacalis]|uniref:sodium-dependent nutrient amino acid transporter 1-like n=1 Tax=Ostrinia furnacalis TaxID=93504 RepID=UPI00103D89F5|nr:sodium-dependent nutrient amino acid transporter 1-like [Ostrinia furnacalis]
MSGENNNGFTMEDPPPTTSADSTWIPDSTPPLTTAPSGPAPEYSKMKWSTNGHDQPMSPPPIIKVPLEQSETAKQDADAEKAEPQRAMWDNQIEFLMSCIATSVGLGNVWRFPFVAYKNGGGAFLIPYIIVLFLVGKPMYYLECIVGQFSSRNSVKVWSLSPAMRGIGYAQALSCSYIVTYYVSIVGLCLYYLAMSFQAELPWSKCDPEWANCVPSAPNHDIITTNESRSSAELYFVHTVLQQNKGLEEGLGAPVWYLALCLFASWVIIFVIVARGVKSSGKAAYFLAIFPYVVMLILLITTLLLNGAGKGILFFITPQWDKLLKLEVNVKNIKALLSLTISTVENIFAI